MRIQFVFLFILLCISTQAQLVIDISHSQPVYPTDAGFAGMSRFFVALDKAGIPIAFRNRPMNLIHKELHPTSTLLLFPAILQSYDSSEVASVRKFVESGGHLILIPEHDNFFKNASEFNKFLNGTGITISYDAVRDFQDSDPMSASWPAMNCSLDTTLRLKLYLPASLKVNSPALTYGSCVGQPVYASTALGVGKISVLADFEIFWNMGSESGIRFGDNQRFLTDVLLGHLKSAKYSVNTSSSDSKKTIVLSGLSSLSIFKRLHAALTNSGYALYIPKFPTDIPTDVYACIHAGSIPDSTLSKRLLSVNKLAIIAPGAVDFLGQMYRYIDETEKKFPDAGMMVQYNKMLNFLGNEDVDNVGYLLNKLSITYKPFILATSRSFVTMSTVYQAKKKKKSQLVFDVNSIEISKGKIYKILWSAASGQKAVPYPAPTDNDERLTMIFSDDCTVKPQPFIMASPKAYVAASPFVYLNYDTGGTHDQFTASLLHWLTMKN